jgi:hypothetical protein
MKQFIFILLTLINTSIFSQDINWGKEQNGLQMGIAYEGDSLVIEMRNVTKNPIQLCRNLNTRSLEFYRLEFSNSQNAIYDLFVGNELPINTQPYVYILMPDEKIVQKVYIEEWKDKNGNLSIPKGRYKVFVYYENSHCHKLSSDHWNGTVSAGAFSYEVK